MYKPHYILILSIFLCTSQLYASEFSGYCPSRDTFYAEFNLRDKGRNSQSYHSRVQDHSWESPTIGSEPKHQPHFKTYDAQAFRDYFTARGYTEQEILNQRCLYMFDEFVKFAQTYSSYTCTIEQLHAELTKLTIFQKAYYIIKGTYCPGLQKRIRYLYNQLHTLKNETSFSSQSLIIQDHAFETFDKHKTEYEILREVYRAYTPSLSAAITKRIDAFNSMTRGDRLYLNHEKKSYKLTSNLEHLLTKYGHDTMHFTECIGHNLHQAVHQESLDILERVDNLPTSSVLYDHQEALVDFTVAMAEYNHEGITDKAMQIGDLCWTLLDYGQAIAEGAALGAYTAVADIINNPVGTTISIVAGKPILAYQLCKILYNVADIGITALTDTNQAKNKWNAYAKPLNDVISAINHKETKVRDILKGGTAFTVGILAQSRLLGGLGKFYDTIKQKAVNFIQNNGFAKLPTYLTTPEGLLLKATANSNKINQTNAPSNLKNTIDGIKKLTTKEAIEIAQKLKFKKTNYYSHGQPVFKKGNLYITPDVDGHNGGIWKMATSIENLKSKKTRLGTYDINLNRIGD